MLETEENDEKDTIWKLECNIDDCTGEALGYCMGKLLRSGARDVHYIPVYMKKNRPAYQLDVICDDTTRRRWKISYSPRPPQSASAAAGWSAP